MNYHHSSVWPRKNKDMALALGDSNCLDDSIAIVSSPTTVNSNHTFQQKMGKTSLDIIEYTNKATPTLAIRWNLPDAQSKSLPEAATLKPIIKTNPPPESFIGKVPEIKRKQVVDKDIENISGKYRGQKELQRRKYKTWLT